LRFEYSLVRATGVGLLILGALHQTQQLHQRCLRSGMDLPAEGQEGRAKMRTAEALRDRVGR
jgi:hypothetical protein